MSELTLSSRFTMLVFAFVHARVRRRVVAAIASQISVGLAPISTVTIASAFSPAQAQTVTTDGTLPTTVTEGVATNQFIVTGGSPQGENLFHSFDTFSPLNHSVLFDLSSELFGNEIEHIFSRVTGSNISEINGSLSILGGNSPDLFLLNPNGIILGPDARLNLSGSFIGATANSIQFSDGSHFRALPLQADSPLLSVSVPVGLQFGQNPGVISVLGSGRNILRPTAFAPPLQDPAFPIQGLSVSPGNTLALIGGDIVFQGTGLINEGMGKLDSELIFGARDALSSM